MENDYIDKIQMEIDTCNINIKKLNEAIEKAELQKNVWQGTIDTNNGFIDTLNSIKDLDVGSNINEAWGLYSMMISPINEQVRDEAFEGSRENREVLDNINTVINQIEILNTTYYQKGIEEADKYIEQQKDILNREMARMEYLLESIS